MTDLFTKVSQIKTGTKVLIVFPVLFFTLMFSLNKAPLQPEITKRPSEGVTGPRAAVPSPELSRTAPTSVVKSSPEAGKEISSLQQHEVVQLKTAPAASTTHKTSQSTVAASDTSLRQSLKEQKNEKIAKVSQSLNTDSEQPILSSQKPVQSSAGEAGSLPKETTTQIPKILTRKEVTREAGSLPKETTALRPVDDSQNLSRCLKGYGSCNRALLTPEQLAQVEVNATQRNLSDCLKGYVGCNRALLTPEQLAQVEVNATQRNLSDCLKGYVGCNRALLTPEQLAQVEQRAQQRRR